MNDEQARQLGEYIRYMRQAHGMNIRGLAAKAGIDNGGLARLERGDVRSPRPETLRALARALGAPLADLFTRAGYADTALPELPGMASYLHAKFGCLSEKETQAITEIVEKLVRLHRREAKTNSEEGIDI